MIEALTKLAVLETGVCSNTHIERVKMSAGNSNFVMVKRCIVLGYARVSGEAMIISTRSSVIKFHYLIASSHYIKIYIDTCFINDWKLK